MRGPQGQEITSFLGDPHGPYSPGTFNPYGRLTAHIFRESLGTPSPYGRASPRSPFPRDNPPWGETSVGYAYFWVVLGE